MSTEQLFEVLSSKRRRYALHYLYDREGDVVELDDVTAQVAAWENASESEEGENGEADAGHRKSVRNSLHQSHLPKLDAYGIVDYDDERGTIAVRDVGDADAYMEVVCGDGFPWSAYFVSLAGAGVLRVTGVQSGVLSFLSAHAWLAILVGVFAVSSVAFWYAARRGTPAGTGVTPPGVGDR